MFIILKLSIALYLFTYALTLIICLNYAFRTYPDFYVMIHRIY